MINVLLSAIAPIALVVLVGAAIGRGFALDLITLARVTIYALLPALVFDGISGSSLNFSSTAGIVAGFLINTTLLYLIARWLGLALSFSEEARKSLITTTVFANVGNMGLPFVLFSLGEAGLERGIVYLVASSLAIATLFPVVLKGEGFAKGIRYSLRLPVFWAALLGIALQGMSVTLPAAAARGIALMANAAVPVALLTLGIQLSRTPFAFGLTDLFGASLRLLLSPLLAFAVGTLLGLDGLDLQVLVIQAAMPVAVNSLIWVTELGGDRLRVAKTVVLSTLLSFLTLP
ncbi:MAG: AEC family transporter, partial [Cyanobacteria bacterium P01_A01_bin.135]